MHTGRGKPRSPARQAGPTEIRDCTPTAGHSRKKLLSYYSSGRISATSTVIEEVEAFRQYVLEHSRTDSTSASLKDLFQRWYASRLSEAELEQSLQSLRRGLADADAGRLVDADLAIQETRARLLQKS